VARGVLRDVRQQADHRGGKTLPADVPRLGESRSIDGAHLPFGVFENALQLREEFFAACPRLVFTLKRGHLLRREGLPPQVGHQTIRAPGNVAQMKTDRSGSARLSPNLQRGKSHGVFRQVLGRLTKRVEYRSQQRIHIRDRPAQPGFGLHGIRQCLTGGRTGARSRRERIIDCSSRIPDMILPLLGATTLAVWIYLLAFRGGFWRMETARRMDAPAPPLPAVVAVIPARDEAEVVCQAIRSLVNQDYRGEFHIVLVDDSSSDGTAEAAQRAVGNELLTVVRATSLPDGWTGKLWAVSQGVAEAERRAPEFLLLTDADITHPPSNLSDLVVLAERDGYDLVSYMARLSCRTTAERVLMPAFVFFFFLLYPPAWIRDPRRATAGAAGGCMLVRREALAGAGGIGAIRSAWIDDCALAGAIKRRGGKVWLGVSGQTRSIRGYAGFGEAGRMISRSAFTQLHHSAWLLVGTVAGLLVTYAAPPALALAASGSARWLGAAAWLVMALCYRPALRFFGRPAYEAAGLPLVALFYLAATVHSACQWWRGGGGRWKGRSQAFN